jgi:Na+/proline symporter
MVIDEADKLHPPDLAGAIPPNRIFLPLCVVLLAGWVGLLVYDARVLPAYMVAGVCTIWAAYRLPLTASEENLGSFFIYERRMPKNEFLGTLVTTNIGFFSSVAFSTILIATFGIGPALIAVGAWIAGLAAFAWQVPKLISFFKTGSTIHEFIGRSFAENGNDRRRLARYSSIITFFLYMASVGVEIKYASDVFSTVTRVPALLLAGLLCISGIFYVALAGYRGVVSTDRIRFWTILVGVSAIFVFLYLYAPREPVRWPAGYLSLRNLTVGPDIPTLLSIVILLVLYQFCVMDMWERCIAIVNTPGVSREQDNEESAARSDDAAIRIIRRTLVVYSIAPFLILFAAWYGIGLLAVSQNWTTNPSEIIPKLFEKLQILSTYFPIIGPLLESAIILCFLSAALSTIDGFLIAAVQTVVFDWLGKRPRGVAVGGISPDRLLLRLSRGLIVVLGLVAVAVSFVSFNLMSFWVGMYALMLSFFPPIWLAMNGSGKRLPAQGTVVSAILVGSGVSLALSVTGTFIVLSPLLSSLSAPAAVLLSGGVLVLGPRAPQPRVI